MVSLDTTMGRKRKTNTKIKSSELQQGQKKNLCTNGMTPIGSCQSKSWIIGERDIRFCGFPTRIDTKAHFFVLKWVTTFDFSVGFTFLTHICVLTIAKLPWFA